MQPKQSLHSCLWLLYIIIVNLTPWTCDCPQGEKGDAGLEGAKGDRGDIGLKGKEGPPGPPGLMGVRVSVSAAKLFFPSVPMNRRLFLSTHGLLRFPFTRVRRVNLA